MRAPVLAFPTLMLLVVGLPLEALRSPKVEQVSAVDELLARSRAAYAALKSYADSGIVLEDVGSFNNRYKFKTRFRKPADFYLEFAGIESTYFDGHTVPLSGHLVFWKLGPNLQTWDELSRTHEIFPQGEADQVGPIRAAMAGTIGTSTLIPSLLFPDAGLIGTLQEIAELSMAGTENVGGHQCRKLVGIARQVYPSGQVTNVRPIAVWLDEQTFLVRKIFTDTPKGYPIGGVARISITLDPQSNPPLDDAKFQFTVPIAQE